MKHFCCTVHLLRAKKNWSEGAALDQVRILDYEIQKTSSLVFY